MLNEMEKQGIQADTVTFTILLKICADNQLIEEGILLHSLIESRGLQDVSLINSLINFYTKCGNFEKAISLFQNMLKNNAKLDVITWTCMIQALVESKRIQEVISLFNEMEKQGIQADTVTFTILLKICADNQLIDEGMHLHSFIEARGLQDVGLSNSLIHFYTKCEV